MILTSIKIHGLKSKRKEIIQTVKGIAEQVSGFQGCLRAEIYQDIENDDILYLMEEWESSQDLDKYRKSKSLAVLLGLESLLVETPEINHAVKCKIDVNNVDLVSRCITREENIEL